MGEVKTYTPEDIAEILHVSRRTVYRYLKDGRLSASQPSGKLWRITEDDLRAFLDNGRPSKK